MKKLLQDKSSFFNPFQYIAGGQALIAGLIIITASAWLGYLNNTWLDGLLDLHYGPPAPFYHHLLMGLINWLSLTLVLYLISVFLSPSRVRLIDVAGTQALARTPMLLAVFTGFLNAPRMVGEYLVDTMINPGQSTLVVTSSHMVIAAITMLLIIILVVWMIALMYNGYRVSANLRGSRAVVSFIAGFIVAYVISKLCIILLSGQGLTLFY